MPLCYHAPMTRLLAHCAWRSAVRSDGWAARHPRGSGAGPHLLQRRASSTRPSPRPSWPARPRRRLTPRPSSWRGPIWSAIAQVRRPGRPRRRAGGPGRASAWIAWARPIGPSILIALGGSLFLEDDFGAAAEIFESAMEIAPAARESAREAVLDWYGSAMERWAAPYVTTRRAADADAAGHADGAANRRRTPGRAPPSYWLVGAACAPKANSTAPGRRRSPPGCGRRSPAPARWRCAPTSTGWCAKASSPTAARKPRTAERESRETALRAEWELVKEKWK